jgi:hypothetical protein
METLSTLLHANTPDLHDWRTRRLRILRLRRAAATPTGSAPRSFSELAGVSQRTPGYAEQADNYHRFLGAVNAALGGESPPDEVAHAAASAFRALQALPEPTAEAAATKPPGISAHGPPGLAAPTTQISRQTMQHARGLLTGGAVSGSGGGGGGGGGGSVATATLNAAAAAASAACAAAFGASLGDEPIRQMVSAHAPLAAWLREHRLRTGGGGGSGGSTTTAPQKDGETPRSTPRSTPRLAPGETPLDASGAASAAIPPPARDAYTRLLRAVEEAAAAAEAAAKAEAKAREERLAANRAASAAAASAAAASAAAAASDGGGSGSGIGGSDGGGGAVEPSPEGTIGWVRERCRMHLYANLEGGGVATDAEVDMLSATLLGQLYSNTTEDALQVIAIDCHRLSPTATPCHQWPPMASDGHRWPPMATDGH